MPQSYSTLILIVLMVVAFYFLILRPSRKRQQTQQQTQNALQPGARVVTGSGFYGTVVAVGTKQIVIEISPGAELTVLKQAIVRVVPPGEEDEDLVEYVDEVEEPDNLVPDAVEPPVRAEAAEPVDLSKPEGQPTERPRDNA